MASASSRMFSAFSTPPVMGTPKCASNSSGTFGAITATVLPIPTPRFDRAEASRTQRSLVSAQVRRMSPWMTDRRFG
jgi:hypothetical protein